MNCKSEADNSPYELELSEHFLSKFYGLHALNAKRIEMLSKAQRALLEVRNREDEAIAEDLLASLSLEAPDREIHRAFLRHTPAEMPQIYRTQGIAEAQELLEALIIQEDQKPLTERNPCPYYNLAYIYHLDARSCPGTEKAAEYLDRGLSLITVAQQALEQQPASPTAHGWRPRATLLAVLDNLRAMIHMTQNDLPACREAVERAIEHDPSLPDAHFTKSVYLSNCKKYDDAILEMHKAIQTFLAQGQTIADPWFHLARTYEKKAMITSADAEPSAARLYDESIACLRQAISIDNDFALAHLKLGLLCLRKDCESAISHFDEALRADIQLYSSIHRVICPPNCKGCSGVRLKMLLMELLNKYKEAFEQANPEDTWHQQSSRSESRSGTHASAE